MPPVGDLIPPVDQVVTIAIGGFIGMNLGTIVKRGRQFCISPVGRPPRDLYADRRINLLVNAVYEWLWIGCAVMFASVVLFFIEATDQYAKYVGYTGLAMVVTCLVVVPFCAARAELNPKYEAETPSPST